MQREFSFVQDTSRAAYAALQPHLGPQQQVVLDYARERGAEGFTDNELAGRMSETHGMDYNSRSRRFELVDKGLIVDTGRRELRPGSKQRSIVWAIA